MTKKLLCTFEKWYKAHIYIHIYIIYTCMHILEFRVLYLWVNLDFKLKALSLIYSNYINDIGIYL